MYVKLKKVKVKITSRVYVKMSTGVYVKVHTRVRKTYTCHKATTATESSHNTDRVEPQHDGNRATTGGAQCHNVIRREQVEAAWPAGMGELALTDVRAHAEKS